MGPIGGGGNAHFPLFSSVEDWVSSGMGAAKVALIARKANRTLKKIMLIGGICGVVKRKRLRKNER